MDGYEKWLAFAQIVSIIVVWIRFENRLSMLEGRFLEFKESVIRILDSTEKRH